MRRGRSWPDRDGARRGAAVSRQRPHARARARRRSRAPTQPTPNGAAATVANNKEVIYVRSKVTSDRSNRPRSPSSLESEAVDVIDLGAPRSIRHAAAQPLPGERPRRAALYTPNPRLYPGPTAKQTQKRKRKRSEGRAGRSRVAFRRPVPNSRLYRPAPRRAPPPPEPARAWPPPAPPAPALDTASRAALRLAARRRGARAPPSPPSPPRPPASPAPPPAPPRSPAAPAPRDRRLVVTLPLGAAAVMEAPPSPEGSEAASAPSEFLAEFLSAIMRRQYAEALKYCRLILQYEPHNATARGFYPLLQHKLQAQNDNDEAAGAGAGPRRASLSDSSGAAPPSRSSSRSNSRSHTPSDDQFRNVASSWEGSGASQSSLELDSSSAERDPPPTDSNGNHTRAPPPPCPDDLENDNDVSSFKSAAEALAPAAAHSSLRRLRARFACSIK